MSTLPQINPAEATGEAGELLAELKKNIGSVPNMAKAMANSPAVLKGWMALSGALSGGALSAPIRERLALSSAEYNRCTYCLSAHTYLGLNLAKIGPEEIALNRRGASSDAKANAAVHFASKVTSQRGHVDEADIAAVRAAGFSDAQIVEIIALVVENTFTNYLNEVAKTDIDFPVVLAQDAA